VKTVGSRSCQRQKEWNRLVSHSYKTRGEYKRMNRNTQ
jgi:hypothetical protein